MIVESNDTFQIESVVLESVHEVVITVNPKTDILMEEPDLPVPEGYYISEELTLTKDGNLLYTVLAVEEEE